MSAGQGPDPTLMGLPLELRLMIYSNIADDEYPPEKVEVPAQSGTLFALARTCRRLRNEVQPLAFRAKTWELSTWSPVDVRIYVSDNMCSALRHSIRHLDIAVTPEDIANRLQKEGLHFPLAGLPEVETVTLRVEANGSGSPTLETEVSLVSRMALVLLKTVIKNRKLLKRIVIIHGGLLKDTCTNIERLRNVMGYRMYPMSGADTNNRRLYTLRFWAEKEPVLGVWEFRNDFVHGQFDVIRYPDLESQVSDREVTIMLGETAGEVENYSRVRHVSITFFEV